MSNDSDSKGYDKGLMLITPQMIEAGIARWREFHFGQSEAEIVEAIYLAMAIELQHIVSASATKPVT